MTLALVPKDLIHISAIKYVGYLSVVDIGGTIYSGVSGTPHHLPSQSLSFNFSYISSVIVIKWPLLVSVQKKVSL